MAAMILDGRALAKMLREELRAEVRAFSETTGVLPSLAVVNVAGDAASEQYLRTIRKACAEVGIACVPHRLPGDAPQIALEGLVEQVSSDESVSGVLLQVPLPLHLDASKAVLRLDPRKDVDGVHPHNAGLLAQGLPAMLPNTPAGGMELLRRANIPLAGKHAVVVGRSAIVGRPMALLLLQEHATVTICHSRTRDLAEITRRAEILVAATGRPGLITGEMIRPGAAVVDFGVNVLADGSVVGDVAYEAASEVAGAITPVPGGTGPVTNAMLLRNVLLAARGR
jgi:methylenetetrahydrofolate dehydrogenase (NADP+)/methenyltetrahydrofolate cyclohydrolase